MTTKEGGVSNDALGDAPKQPAPLSLTKEQVDRIMEVVESEGSIADDRLEEGDDHGSVIVKMQNAVRTRLTSMT